jgi:hypothetical protein
MGHLGRLPRIFLNLSMSAKFHGRRLIDRRHNEEAATYRDPSTVVFDMYSPVVGGRRSDPPSNAGCQD